MEMGKKWHKNGDNTKNQNALPLPRDYNSATREQSWLENKSDEMTEACFRRWLITNFSELKEYVLTQCKETKNLEKRLMKHYEE